MSVNSIKNILFSKLFWPTVRKNCTTDQEKVLKFEAEGWSLQMFWGHVTIYLNSERPVQFLKQNAVLTFS